MEEFENLPRRIFLDSSIIQILTNYGEFIWNEDSLPRNARIRKIKNGMKNLIALQNIIFVNGRANFELALSKNSMKEVEAKHDKNYLCYAFELLDHWIAFANNYENGDMFAGAGYSKLRLINKKMFGYLSKKDKLLIFDAVKFECDTFLTMEEKLVKNTKHLEDNLNLRILRPFEYWKLLKPWAALWM